MTINQRLLRQIRTTIGNTVASNLNSSSAACDLFEVYVFTLLIEAAKNERANISYTNVLGQTPPPSFIFRTSPGHIFSTQQAYTHAVIEFPQRPTLEAHIGVKVSGKSGVMHECDVAVIFHDEAEICRRGGVAPRYHKVFLSVECKFYASTIPLHQARSFMGLLNDLPNGNDRFFVVNTNSDNAEKMLAHHRKNWEHNLVPDATAQVNKLRTAFEIKFANYKAKFS